MILHAVTIGSVRMKQADADLRCYRLSGIGFTWRCRCGEHGKIHGSFTAARVAGQAHVAEHVVPLDGDRD